jgi:hypothetical protein
MVVSRTLENAHKFVYLAKAYPEKKVNEIINLFRLSPIDINCAIWLALDKKWVEIVDREEVIEVPHPKKPKKKVEKKVQVSYAKVIGKPAEWAFKDQWNFGAEVKELEASLVYAFAHLNAEEKDLEENYVANWLTGYAPQDTLIAIKHLLETDILHEYEIEDGDSAYIFYTLKENAGKNWGTKQFKANPLTGEPNDTDEKSE